MEECVGLWGSEEGDSGYKKIGMGLIGMGFSFETGYRNKDSIQHTSLVHGDIMQREREKLRDREREEERERDRQ